MKKKIFSFLLCLAMILPCAVLFTACGEATPKSISISSATTEFYHGDEFSVGTQAEIEVKMSKGSSRKFTTENLEYNAETKTASTDDYTIDYSAYDGTTIGEYDITLTYNANTKITTTYKVEVKNRSFANETITISGNSEVYDGEPHTITVFTSVSDITTTYSLDGTNYTSTRPSLVNAGTYTVYYKLEKANYDTYIGQKTVTITPKEASLVWTNTESDYNGEVFTPTCVIDNLVGTDTCNVTVSGGQTNAGTYVATATALSNSNYTLPTGATHQFTINPKVIAKPVISGETSFEYNKADHGIAFVDEIPEGVIMTGDNTAQSAGSYTYTASLESLNYVWEDETVADVNYNWEITKKAITVPTVSGTYNYDGNEKVAIINGYDATVMGKSGTESATDAGSYDVVFVLLNTGNYYWAGDDIGAAAGAKTRSWQINKVASPNPAEALTLTKNIDEGDELTLADFPLTDYAGYAWVDETTAVTESGDYSATYTANATNYTPVSVQVHITLTVTPALTYYTYDGVADTAKDVAFVVPNTVYDGTAHQIEVYVDAEKTTGNASEATITYNGSETSPAYTEPGSYIVTVTIVADGFVTLNQDLTIVISKIAVEADGNPGANYAQVTEDDTLSVVGIDAVTVKVAGKEIEVPGTWAWKNPAQPLILGDNNYVAVFTPTDDAHYETLEKEIAVTTSRGAALPGFSIGSTNYATRNLSGSIYYELEYGQTTILDLSSLRDGFVAIVTDTYGRPINVENLSEIVLVSSDISYEYCRYCISVKAEGAEESAPTEFSCEIYIIAPTHLYSLLVSLDGEDDPIDLLTSSGVNVSGYINGIEANAKPGYTAQVYFNGTLVGADISEISAIAGTSKVTVVVRDGESNIVCYVERTIWLSNSLDTSLSEFTYGNVATEETIEVTTHDEDAVLYKWNGSEYEAVSDLTSVALADGVNKFEYRVSKTGCMTYVYKYVICKVTPENEEVVEQNISDVFEYDELSSINYLATTSNGNSQQPIYSSELSLYGEDGETPTVEVIGLPAGYQSTVTPVGENYYIVKIYSDEVSVYRVVKVTIYGNSYNPYQSVFVDNNTRANVYVTSTLENTVAPVSGTTVEFDSLSGLYIVTVNPGATISTEDPMFDCSHGSVTALSVCENHTLVIRVTATDGTTYEDITLTVTVTPVKVFGITPVVYNEAGEGVEEGETTGDELVCYYAGMFGNVGDIALNFMTYTAIAKDDISHYTIYNAEGNVYSDADATAEAPKYIKVNIFSLFSVYREYDESQGEYNGLITDFDGVLFEIDESKEGIGMVYMYFDCFNMPLSATLILSDGEAVSGTVTLTVPGAEEGDEPVQVFEISLDVYSPTVILGDYFYKEPYQMLMVGSFEDDDSYTRYYLDEDTGDLYALDGREVSTTKVGKVEYDDEVLILAEEEEGCLETIELGTAFMLEVENVPSLSYLLGPNDDAMALMEAALESGETGIEINVEAEGCTVQLVTRTETYIDYDEIENSTVETQLFEGAPGMMIPGIELKLTFNAGEADEFSVILQIAFISIEDMMGQM